MTTATMNSSKANRKFILLALVLGMIGAILVYAAFSRDSGGSGSAATDTIPVVVAKQDVAARTRLTASMLEVRLVPADAVSESSYSDVSEVVGKVTRFPLTANEHVLPSKVIAPDGRVGVSRSLAFTIPEGKRGIAIRASQISNAGGLVLPGDYVDILVVYDLEFGSGDNKETYPAYLVQTILQNVEILAVDQTIVDTVPDGEVQPNGQRARNSESSPNADAATITIAVTPEEAQMIYLAEANGQIRLTVRPFGDGQEVPLDLMVEHDLLPQNIPAPVAR